MLVARQEPGLRRPKTTECAVLWKGRKSAFSAWENHADLLRARRCRSRSSLSVLAAIERLSQEHGLPWPPFSMPAMATFIH